MDAAVAGTTSARFRPTRSYTKPRDVTAGNAGSNTAADHLIVIREALRQLPFHTGGRVGRKVLVRIDGAGATHDVVNYLVARGLSYSIGLTLPSDTADLLKLIRTQRGTVRGAV